MWRHVIHSTDPAPELEGDRWMQVLCPRGSIFEILEAGRCRFRIGRTWVSCAPAKCPDCDFSGPAFEVTTSNGLSRSAAYELFEGMWERFTRAIMRSVPLPGGRKLTWCNAHARSIEWPERRGRRRARG